MSKFTNKVVFITGSSKGIGKHLAKSMLNAGARVVINGRNPEALGKTAQELKETGGELMEIAADVSRSDACRKAIETIISHFGKLDIIVLNAGLSSYGLIEDTGDETLDSVMRVNTLGPFIGAKMALPHIRKTRGSIVLISSLAGLQGIPRSAVYSMSKMALTALAQSLKTELTGTGVHVGIIYVGFTQNDPNKTAIGPDGKLRPIQDRPAWVQQSPDKVAGMIMRNIKHRRFKMVLSPMGKMVAFLSRYLPRIYQYSMRGVLKSAEKLTADN